MGNTSSSPTLEHQVRAVSDHVAALLNGLEPRDVPLPEAPGVLAAFVELERRAAAGRVLLAARAAESNRWKRDGFASPAEWLAAQSGTSTGRARDDLKTSERLEDLDETAEAMRRGKLSPDQVAAVADAATANPNAERDLLDHAGRESLADLKDEAARRKAEVEDLEARERRIRRGRRCRSWTDREGYWNLAARGPVADGSALMVELERLTIERFQTARRAGEFEAREAYAFDALMGMARRSHAPAAASRAGGGGAEQARASSPERARAPEAGVDPAREPSAGPPSLFDANSTSAAPETEPEPRRDRPDPIPLDDKIPPDPPARENLRHLALLHVDLAALIRGEQRPGERCEIPGLGPVSVDTARSLLGDAILKLVISNGVDVLNVTHLGRGPNMAQQVALLWSQPKCCVAGCNRRARLQVDHRRPFAADRVTELGNLDRLCDVHHQRKTRDGWALVMGSGRRAMVPPGDPGHPDSDPSRAGPGSARPGRPRLPDTSGSSGRMARRRRRGGGSNAPPDAA